MHAKKHFPLKSLTYYEIYHLQVCCLTDLQLVKFSSLPPPLPLPPHPYPPPPLPHPTPRSNPQNQLKSLRRNESDFVLHSTKGRFFKYNFLKNKTTTKVHFFNIPHKRDILKGNFHEQKGALLMYEKGHFWCCSQRLDKYMPRWPPQYTGYVVPAWCERRLISSARTGKKIREYNERLFFFCRKEKLQMMKERRYFHSLLNLWLKSLGFDTSKNTYSRGRFCYPKKLEHFNITWRNKSCEKFGNV